MKRASMAILLVFDLMMFGCGGGQKERANSTTPGPGGNEGSQDETAQERKHVLMKTRETTAAFGTLKLKFPTLKTGAPTRRVDRINDDIMAEANNWHCEAQPQGQTYTYAATGKVNGINGRYFAFTVLHEVSCGDAPASFHESFIYAMNTGRRRDLRRDFNLEQDAPERPIVQKAIAAILATNQIPKALIGNCYHGDVAKDTELIAASSFVLSLKKDTVLVTVDPKDDTKCSFTGVLTKAQALPLVSGESVLHAWLK